MSQATLHATPHPLRRRVAFLPFLILILGFAAPLTPSQAFASQVFFLVPSVADHHCGSNPYWYNNKVDVYMKANGSTNCNTIRIKSALRPNSITCDFYMMNPDHGGPYKGTTNAYVGIFSGQAIPFTPTPKLGIKRVLPSPSNTWVYLGKYQSEFVTAPINWPSPPSWDTYFEIADNNGAKAGVIGVSQIKEICPH